MTSSGIRPFQPEDAAAVLALLRELLPLRVESEASVRRLATAARCWVAEDGAEVVGFGRVQERRLWIGVLAAARNDGVGSALWARVEEHAHEPAVCWADDESGIAFAEARGFSRGARRLISVLDPTATAVPELPERDDVRLVPWSQLDELPTGLEGLERAESPDLAADGSFVAFLDGRPAAFALLTADEHGVAENEFTATLPELRGRGLATLCKLAAIRWARENAIHTVVAGNDAGNAPMLAINERLGYVLRHERIEFTRT